jgi:ADP-heptose:LPS heptosyltransferase
MLSSEEEILLDETFVRELPNMLETHPMHQAIDGPPPYVFLKQSYDMLSETQKKTDTPRYLLTMYKGIGDAVALGLSALDQIVQEDPLAYGAIDVFCTGAQAELFEHDPRINRLILADEGLFSLPEVALWLKSILLDSKISELVRFLRKREYIAIFPSMFAPGFYARLHAAMMNPDFIELAKDWLALRRQVERPMSSIAREMVSRYFRRISKSRHHPQSSLKAERSASIPLYLSSTEVQNASTMVSALKERAGVSVESGKLLVVASDAASVVTRPPTSLLAPALAAALARCPNLIVCILQGLTDAQVGEDLLQSLGSDFAGRVFMAPAEPRARLLDVAAFIDQADIFVTGDTGLMHIAAAHKQLREDDRAEYLPHNSVKIIALFGGTNPHLYGYREQTTILGGGRKEQMTFVPGIFKESYDPKGRDMFDHISPQQLTEAILNQ